MVSIFSLLREHCKVDFSYYKPRYGHPANRTSHDHEELSFPLMTGIRKLLNRNQEMRFSNIFVSRPDGKKLIVMCIRPLPCKGDRADLLLDNPRLPMQDTGEKKQPPFRSGDRCA